MFASFSRTAAAPSTAAEINAYLNDIATDDAEIAALERVVEAELDEQETRRMGQAWNLVMFGNGDSVWVNEDGTTETWASHFTPQDREHWLARGYTNEQIDRVNRARGEDDWPF